MKFVFDIDGVICTNTNGDYGSAEPNNEVIQLINDLAMQGHYITLHTARGMGRTNNNRKKAKKMFKTLTKFQLKKWNVIYNSLVMGKPAGDYYIDDKMISFEEIIKKVYG